MNTRRRSSVLAVAFLLSGSLFAQQSTPDAPQPSTPASQSAPAASPQALPDSPDTQAHISPQPIGPTVLFDTTMGRMTCRLFDKQAPEAVANFVGLATGTKVWTDPKTKQKMEGKPFYDQFYPSPFDPTGSYIARLFDFVDFTQPIYLAPNFQLSTDGSTGLYFPTQQISVHTGSNTVNLALRFA